MPKMTDRVYYSLKNFFSAHPSFKIDDEGYSFASLYAVKKSFIFPVVTHIGCVSDDEIEIRDEYYSEFIRELSIIAASFEKQSGKSVSIVRTRVAR